MKIRVCDALCGQGKTMSCINMINSSHDDKFIFITPYLDEVERIKTSCPDKEFYSPERKPSNGYSKLNDLPSLLREGKNIASTHALFSSYNEEIKTLIREQHYTLILDEVIDLFQPANIDGGDMKFLVRNNIAKVDGDEILWDDDEYDGSAFSEIANCAKSKNLVDYDGTFYFWALPIDVFRCFENAYILTYLFDYQLMRYYLLANNLDYELIGTKKENGVYQFCKLEEMNRAIDIKNKIHIINDRKFNDIGNGLYDLSSGWFDRARLEPGQPKLNILKNNIYNFFRRKPSNNNNKMWTTLKKYKSFLKGKGYSNSFLTYNKRAVNNFADKICLAYCINVYMQPWMKNYLHRIGQSDVSQDMFALSVLIQWIFRSAIRKGQEVWIYIPSKRMRTLLIAWIDNLREGNDLQEIKYNKKTKTFSKEVVHEEMHKLHLGGQMRKSK